MERPYKVIKRTDDDRVYIVHLSSLEEVAEHLKAMARVDLTSQLIAVLNTAKEGGE